MEIEIIVFFITIIVCSIYMAIKNIKKRVSKNEEDIENLKFVTRIFCDGKNIDETIEIDSVIYKLLDILGYDLVSEKAKLIKKKKVRR